MISSINKEHRKHTKVPADVVVWCRDQLALLNNTSTQKNESSLSKKSLPPTNGLVLCGGKSTRMGIDKGGIQYHNKTQREYVFELLSGLCNDTFLSCNQQQESMAGHNPFIKDIIQGLGPAGGILSAFQQNTEVAWLTVACDLPYLDKETIQQLIKHRNPQKTATAFWDAEGKFPEPLVTIWEPKAYVLLLENVSNGLSCPRKVLINSEVEMITALDVSVFANVNTMRESEEVFWSINNKKAIAE